MGRAHWCHHGRCATGKGKDCMCKTKENGEIVKYCQIRYTFGKRGETEDVCFLTSNRLIFNQWSRVIHVYHLFLLHAVVR